MKRAWLIAVLLVSGCAATVTRQSYACIRSSLCEELEAAERTDYERFQSMLAARVEAGTCISLAPGQQVTVGDKSLDGTWSGLIPPGVMGSPYDHLWTRSTVLK